MAVLFAKYLCYDFDRSDGPTNDHLKFSKGNALPLLYTLFTAAGMITDEELFSFPNPGSRFEGHIVP